MLFYQNILFRTFINFLDSQGLVYPSNFYGLISHKRFFIAAFPGRKGESRLDFCYRSTFQLKM